MTAPATNRAWFVGEGTLLVRCVEVYLAAGHDVAGIASTDLSVKRWADGRAIRLVAPGAEFAAAVHDASFDYLFSIVNLTRLDASIVAAPRVIAANFHDGPLPAYAGLNAPVWALLAGERRYGVTWHEMTSTVDGGRILAQQLFDVPEGETSFGLNARCYEAGLQAFTELVAHITNGTVAPRDQDLEKRTVFRRLDRPAHGCVIDWTEPADSIVRLIHALDFGPYANPFASPRLLTRGGAFLVTSATASEVGSAVAPGTVMDVTGDAVVVATATGPLAITGVRRVTGEVLSVPAFAAEAGLRPGDNLDEDMRGARSAIEPWLATATREEAFWLERLVDLQPLELPWSAERRSGTRPTDRTRLVTELPADLHVALLKDSSNAGALLLGAVLAYLVRLAGARKATVPFTSAASPTVQGRGASVVAHCLPVVVDLDGDWLTFRTAFAEAAHEADTHGTFFLDVCARNPAHASLKTFGRWAAHLRGVVSASPSQFYAPPDVGLALVASADGRTLTWDAAADVFGPDAVRRMERQCLGFLRAIVLYPSQPLSRLALVSAEERQRLLVGWNETATPVPETPVHELIATQTAATPDHIALVCRGESLTYRDLNGRVNQVARHLQTLGVGPDVPVGLCLNRSTDMVVGLLAVLKAGGAYVPLNPGYPRDRLAFIVEDVGLTLVITERDLADRFPNCRRIDLRTDRETIARHDTSEPEAAARAADLAYVIYTSGSTGKPKGVMIEHGNVSNFLVAMDASVPHDPPGVWLAVTSISFDISVLELLWTLSRGFTVVLYTGEEDHRATGTALSRSSRPIDFSLFYFSADERSDGREKYRLLLDGAKFADGHDFAAVWTPERHFHAFGGLYPNPSVTGAAVAAVTSRVGIRAGSCVLPLHHPLRVVEEWSVVDNLSNGRVGIAFASGWQPNDFILRPENYVDRKAVLFRDIATVQALWRGEAVPWATPRGERLSVQTMPRPVQASLPTWITAAGNPETFTAAAAIGAGVLTHLLGQSVDELAAKIAAYRDAWKAAGHAGSGHVVLMLHTLVSDSDEFVRDAVRQPLMDYLRTSIDLVKPFAESFPTFAARPTGQNLSAVFASLTEADYDALVEHSFERYYQTSGLFGRPETCLDMIDRLKAIGVSEIACLIDFGVATDIVLDNLPHLNTLRERANGIADAADFSIPALVGRHGVTHLQCTPSMARMLLLDPSTEQSLASLKALFVGGEALPSALAADLVQALPTGEVWNMYGPTETTVWSTTWRVDRTSPVSIGRPIANTQIYILDDAGEPVPTGLPGHLFIGGTGVARGYWARPELSAERFRRNPFVADDRARMYFTGDLARYRDDGLIEFLGRSDQQVKIRGHRIELGEIEATIATHPAVREVVVHAREDVQGDKRLVAYVILREGGFLDYAAMKAHVGAALPDYQVPSHLAVLASFPLTPNNKIDRQALPAPDAQPRPAGPPPVALASALERQVADVWREVLRNDAIGGDDNFFDIGGDSLLAAEVLSVLRQQVTPSVSLTDLFRFPTVRSLAAHLGGGDSSSRVSQSVDRARLRQDALQQRRAARSSVTPAGNRS